MKTAENQKNSPYIYKIALKNTLKKEGGVGWGGGGGQFCWPIQKQQKWVHPTNGCMAKVLTIMEDIHQNLSSKWGEREREQTI